MNITTNRAKPKFDLTTYKIKANLKKSKTTALLSDIHNRPFDWIANELEKHHPDLIAVTGDFVDGYGIDKTPDETGFTPLPKSVYPLETNILPFLNTCASIAPTFVSLGNHEIHLPDGDLERIGETGAILLDNEWIEWGELCIGGLTSATVMEKRAFYGRHPSLKSYYPSHRVESECKMQHSPLVDNDFIKDFADQRGIKILLCHHPEYWKPILSQYDLVCLSGHTHGAMWRIFNHGIYAPGQGLFPKYSSGVHQKAESTLVISRGLSNTVRIPRINNRLEIVFVEIG